MYNVRVMLNSKVKNNLIICLVVVVAGILDFATATLFQTVLHVPLFLDMTFAMAVLFAYGVLPAIMTYVVNVICGCLKLVFLYGKNDYVYLFTLSALTPVFALAHSGEGFKILAIAFNFRLSLHGVTLLQSRSQITSVLLSSLLRLYNIRRRP
jgi:hypothetical protein